MTVAEMNRGAHIFDKDMTHLHGNGKRALQWFCAQLDLTVLGNFPSDHLGFLLDNWEKPDLTLVAVEFLNTLEGRLCETGLGVFKRELFCPLTKSLCFAG